MVASISARGSARAALAYYGHLQQDGYYTAESEAPGRWAGRGAERLSLEGPVTRSEFEAALEGLDPKTGERLAAGGGRAHSHAAGWDMTFSAPKSVSVLWALSDGPERAAIEEAHRRAVLTATGHLEQTAAWARRGKGGALRERTAGLLMAQFDHHTSRELDPQLHTHSFVFNLAPRRDGTWGAIVSRDLYKAQKQAGAVYRRELAAGLERLGHRLERQAHGFRIAAVPRRIERAFSKRRQVIEEAARTHGYDTAKGMELATLRTRRAKQDSKLNDLYRTWQAEAKALGFDLRQAQRESSRESVSVPERNAVRPTHVTGNMKTVSRTGVAPSPGHAAIRQNATRIGRQLGQALQALKQSSGMPGLKPRLRQKDRDHERE
ncbi:MobF family relaxase [Nitratireductor sp. XY-223]|uniref:MobF family relaxase n=1 Tax=Nitratireductor sp. XY-223 TaxID=2561926 RepID=UPI0010A9E073|nr:MobF family relaxase [Nitratireductor sp. XY-223]